MQLRPPSHKGNPGAEPVLHYVSRSARLHFVTHSANEDRKSSTARRITVFAQRLTDERGFDGFTMDDLAGAAGLSRRTLFNYFPSKADAVLGAGPELDDEFIQEFRVGGPTGDLVEDLG